MDGFIECDGERGGGGEEGKEKWEMGVGKLEYICGSGMGMRMNGKFDDNWDGRNW